MSSTTWSAVIGLEVHCQLKTLTKLFCGCPNQFGAEPNTLSCPVCAGHPGALPVLNEQALALALRAALALGGEIDPSSRFERKSYFYCDLPKGYQISQYARPYCKGGGIVLRSGKRVRWWSKRAERRQSSGPWQRAQSSPLRARWASSSRWQPMQVVASCCWCSGPVWQASHAIF